MQTVSIMRGNGPRSFFVLAFLVSLQGSSVRSAYGSEAPSNVAESRYYPLRDQSYWLYKLEVREADGRVQSEQYLRTMSGPKRVGDVDYFILSRDRPDPSGVYPMETYLRRAEDGIHAGGQRGEGQIDWLAVPDSPGVGRTWQGDTFEGRTTFTVLPPQDANVPAGTFRHCTVIASERRNAALVFSEIGYYAPGVGKVLNRMTGTGPNGIFVESTSSLIEYSH